MSNMKSNWPNAADPNVTASEMSAKIAIFNEMRRLPKIQKNDPEGLEKRVDEFFQFCCEKSVKPTVEALALVCGVTRETLCEWQHSGSRNGEIITRAKSVINALMTDWGVEGKLNPVTMIWLQKNNYGYSDSQTVTIEANTNQAAPTMSKADLMALVEEDTLQLPEPSENFSELPKVMPREELETLLD